MNRLGNFLRRRIAWLAILILAMSETLILHWGRIVAGAPGLEAAWAPLWILGIALGNLGILLALRSLSWDLRSVWISMRVFMLASMGALLTGPLLAIILLAALASLWLAERLLGADLSGTSFFAAGGGLAVALGFGSILWGYLVGQRRVEVTRVEIPIRDLPTPLAGLRIVQISDLHIGRQLRAPLIRKLIDRVNEVDADLIVLTGDIFDFDPRFIDEGCRELARLRARLGIFGVLGNHDIYTGAEKVAAGIAQHTKIRLLRDEWVQIPIEGAHLYLVGIDDPGKGWTERDAESPALEALARDVPRDGPSVLLIHRPAFFRQAARLGFPLSLAGHTHGGQISLPPPAHHHNVSRLISRWTRGLFRDGDAYLYVNRGLGVAGPPVRINCSREIALIRLVAAR